MMQIIVISIVIIVLQDSRTLIVTYRICNEMKKWPCSAECATEQITKTSTLYTVFTARGAGIQNLE